MELPTATDASGKAVSVPPPEYERFAMRRLFWREFGRDYDQMTRKEIAEALLFLRLEELHPQRFKRKDNGGS